MSTPAVVLLSGGLDSTAALCWATTKYQTVRALACDYGQPNRDAELYAARDAAETLGIQYTSLALADAMRSSVPVGLMAGADRGSVGGLARSFIPGRNLLLATIAAAHACTWWPMAFDIILGCCAEDQGTFPDCKPTTLAQLGLALHLGCMRSVMIRTPWADKTKADILRWASADPWTLDIIRRSYSCYRCQKDGPCEECDACIKRGNAFDELGMADLSAAPYITGGDPHREVA